MPRAPAPAAPSLARVGQNSPMGPHRGPAPRGTGLPVPGRWKVAASWRLAGIAALTAAAAVIGATGLWTSGPGGPAARDGAATTERAATASAARVPALAGAVAGGRFVRTASVGGMTVAPDPSAGATPLGLDLSEASALAARTVHLGAPEVVGFGLVTVTGVTPPARTAALTGTPAWVAVAPPGEGVYHCPPMTAAPTSTPRHVAGHGVYTAAVFFGDVASGGPGAVLYTSTGSLPCGGTAEATLADARAAVPVAWHLAGPVGPSTSVDYRAPACSHLASVSAAGSAIERTVTVALTVTVPFDRTGCDGVRTFTATVRVPASAPSPAGVRLVPKPVPPSPPALLAPLHRGHRA